MPATRSRPAVRSRSRSPINGHAPATETYAPVALNVGTRQSRSDVNASNATADGNCAETAARSSTRRRGRGRPPASSRSPLSDHQETPASDNSTVPVALHVGTRQSRSAVNARNASTAGNSAETATRTSARGRGRGRPRSTRANVSTNVETDELALNGNVLLGFVNGAALFDDSFTNSNSASTSGNQVSTVTNGESSDTLSQDEVAEELNIQGAGFARRGRRFTRPGRPSNARSAGRSNEEGIASVQNWLDQMGRTLRDLDDASTSLQDNNANENIASLNAALPPPELGVFNFDEDIIEIVDLPQTPLTVRLRDAPVVDIIDLSTPVANRIRGSASGENSPASHNLDSSRNESQIVDKRLQCAICMENMLDKEPTVAKCGHIFCGECIKRAIHLRHVCPLCNTRLTSKALTRVYF